MKNPDLYVLSSQAGSRHWGCMGRVTIGSEGEIMEPVDNGLRTPTALSEIRRAKVRDLFYNLGTATEAALHWVNEFLESTDRRSAERTGRLSRGVTAGNGGGR